MKSEQTKQTSATHKMTDAKETKVKKNAASQSAIHNIEPVFDADSRILILGSFPSVKSREAAFFYHHPQNRFWKVLAGVTGDDVPVTIEEKKAFLHRHHIAVWDVIASCTITGSSDASIRDVVPNPVSELLEKTKINRIFVNGKTAEKLYNRYLKAACGQEATVLPSTSPANAAWKLPELTEAWKTAICEADRRQ